MSKKEKIELRTLKRRYGQQPGANFTKNKKKDNDLIDDRETSPRCKQGAQLKLLFAKPPE